MLFGRSYGFSFNTLNAESNAIYHLLALVGAHHILYVSGVRVKAAAFKYCQYSVI